MAFDPIDSLNQQILGAIGATVTDSTEKQNCADAIETFINNNPGFVVEVLNDTLRNSIVNDHDSHAVVVVDDQNVVSTKSVSLGEARQSLADIKTKERKDAIDAAVTAADTQNILGQSHDDFVASLT